MADTLPRHDIHACYGSRLHCVWHNRDEPDGYRGCGECLHSFQTPAELLAEHNRVLAELDAEYDPNGDPAFAITTPVLPETDPAKVFACPFCAHDF